MVGSSQFQVPGTEEIGDKRTCVGLLRRLDGRHPDDNKAHGGGQNAAEENDRHNGCRNATGRGAR